MLPTQRQFGRLMAANTTAKISRQLTVGDSLSVETTGIVYRNPKPYLRSIVAYHPSLVPLPGNELLATFDIGQAVEALDYHTVVTRSLDGGETWNLEGRLLKEQPPSSTHTIRTTRLRDNSLVGIGGLHHRNDPERGLVNREVFGMVPVDLFLVRSTDGGRSWTRPQTIDPPWAGPSWEICHPVLELDDGRWLYPTASWRGWNGEDPSGEQAVVFISDDQGENWLDSGRTFDGRHTGLTHFEQSVIQLQDGRILAVSWVYDFKKGSTLPTEYSISEDRGQSFKGPMATGFHAQTCKVIQLRDGRILCVYRRHDEPGLWATLARLQGDRWINLSQVPLWQGGSPGMSGKAAVADELSALQFGYPSIRQISSERVLLLFWCQEDCVTLIRWTRLLLG